MNPGLKGRNSIPPFQGWALISIRYQGQRASHLPLAIVLRAFGAFLVEGLFLKTVNKHNSPRPFRSVRGILWSGQKRKDQPIQSLYICNSRLQTKTGPLDGRFL